MSFSRRAFLTAAALALGGARSRAAAAGPGSAAGTKPAITVYKDPT